MGVTVPSRFTVTCAYIFQNDSHAVFKYCCSCCAEGCRTSAPTVPNATPSQQTNHRRQGATVTYTCSPGYAFDNSTRRLTSQSTCTNQAVWSDPGACIGTAFFSDFVFFCFFFFLFNKLFCCLWRYNLYI